MEVRNYIIVRDCPPDRVAEALTEELVKVRKWEQVSADTMGVHVVEIWPAADGLTVADLTTWEEADASLAKAVSTACKTTAAAYFFFSPAEEVNELAVFSSGRKVPAKKSPFAMLEHEEVWDFTPVAGAEPITLTFRDARSERVTQATALIEEHLEPLLLPLGFRPGKIAADYPTIQFAVGFVRRLDDGQAVWVRYSFPKESVTLTLKQDLWLQKGRNEYDAIYRGQETRFLPDANKNLLPALLHRECRLLASQLVLDCAPQIADKVPSLAAELKAASSSEAWRQAATDREGLERTKNVARERGPAWVNGTVVFRGAQLLVVQADGSRFTFKFDTSRIPDAKDIAVGDLWESWTGSLSARKLKVDNTVVAFDYDGTVLQS